MIRPTYPDLALPAVARRHGGRPPARPDAGSVQQAAGAEPASSDPPHSKGNDGRGHGEEAHEEEGGGGRDDGGEGRWMHPWIVDVGDSNAKALRVSIECEHYPMPSSQVSPSRRPVVAKFY